METEDNEMHPGEKLEQPIPADPIPVRAEGAPVAEVEAVKTAEQWATELGHLPEFITPAAPKGQPKKAMRAVYNPKAQLFLATKHAYEWPVGKELTKAEYLAAVEAATTHVFR